MADLAPLILEHTRSVEDFPEPGILFRDLSPLFVDAPAFGRVTDAIADNYRGRVDLVCGIEARGFVVAPPVALALGVGFVPVRKAGKLPGDVLSRTYDLEYGTATIEVAPEPFAGTPRVLLLDDVLATGGTAAAAVELVRQAGAEVVAAAFVLELSGLAGRELLTDVPVHSLATV